ncbi:WxcM-like protein [Arcicella aurantiaca]|uniref:WxcM-like protein n=1 Tax=Arcicella aurantiaca TaxID=591202 RepID=A0A316ED43_9BACT|nr:FdtA/QdtA family cupin domain-containing protein [Arcicella aurantiaca]PWK27573.1 WxcM-like protein [Arcicella aurantiaca]
MAKLIILPQFIDERGELTVVENLFPHNYKSVCFIKNADGFVRERESKKKSHQALICINGSVDVSVKLNGKIQTYTLSSSNQCLLLKPEEWNILDNFKNNAILLVASNENYAIGDL